MARRPSMNSLRLFLQVARTLSFSETARTAHLSQPALSRTIKLLEEELGVLLFDRDSRNVRLTQAGAALVPTVERLAADFDLAFRELAQTFEGVRGRVVVGAMPSVAAQLLPRAIASFTRTRPQVEIVVREDPTGALEQNLQDRLIDLAVSTPPAASDAVAFQPLFHDDCVLVGRPEDVADLPDPAPWSAFSGRPFIALEPRSSVRRLTDLAFAKADIALDPRYDCTQVSTVGGLVAEGLGLSLLPRSTLRLLSAEGRVAWRRMQPPQASRTIGVCTLRGRSLAPAAAGLLETLVAENGALQAACEDCR